MAGARLNASSLGRFVTLGGLAGRVGASVVGNQVLDLVRSGPARQLRRTENLVRYVDRIADSATCPSFAPPDPGATSSCGTPAPSPVRSDPAGNRETNPRPPTQNRRRIWFLVE